MRSVRPATRRPGQLRNSIRIERRVLVVEGTTADQWNELNHPWEEDSDDWVPDDGDGAGNYETAFAPMLEGVPASIEAKRGGEEVQADRLAGVSLWEIWVRADYDTRKITVADRVIDEDDPKRIFNVKFAEALDQGRRWILLQCEKGVRT